MPAKSSYQTLAWHSALLEMLPYRGRGLTAGEIVERLKESPGISVTKRSVERCLANFSDLSKVKRDKKTKPFRWLRESQQSVVLPSSDTPEALALSLLGDVMRQLMPPAVAASFAARQEEARQTLDQVGASRFREWTKRARFVAQSLPSIPPGYSVERLKVIQEAIISRMQLQVNYLSPQAKRTSSLTLHPLAFVQKGSISYLVASAFEYDEPRIYAVHRFRLAKLTKEPAREIEGFDLDEYLAKGEFQFGSGQQIKLQAILTNKLACYLSESRLAADQDIKQLSCDRFRLTATLPDSWQLGFWILSQGDDIVVEEPEDLRANIQERLRDALDGYGSKSKRGSSRG